MIYFSLPGILEFQDMNLWFLKLYQQKRHFFYSEAIIDSIYGSFPGIIWNGGRNLPNQKLERSDIEHVFNNYDKFNVKLRFTFTNLLINSQHLRDDYANFVLSIIKNHSAEITIANDVLKEYITHLYPKATLISSTTKCLTALNEVNSETCKDYKLVVLDFRKNGDFNFLNKLKNKDKIELLLNEDCYSTCNQRLRHYKDISQNILMYDKMPSTEYYCKGKYKNLYDSLQQNTTITVDQLYNDYKNLGFKYFKLKGRSSCCFDVLESYVYYLIKPEYRDQVRLTALQQGVCRSF